MPGKLLWSGLLLLAAFVLYAGNLGRAPVYLHEAEVVFALHAHSIAMTAHDTNGRLLPLYFQVPAIGENVWFHPVIVYFMAPFLRLLPLTEFAIRLPSVFVGLTDLVLMYWIGKRLFNSARWALVASVLLALTPAHYLHSRMAMDYLYPVPFVMAWLLCFLIFTERGEVWMLLLATSFLGIGFYSYIASVIMMPIYLLMTWLTLFQTRPRPMRQYLVAVAGFAWPLVILVLWVSFHSIVIGQTLGRYQIGQIRAVSAVGGRVSMAVLLEQVRNTVRFSELTGRVSLYWYFFDPAYLFLSGGYANVVNSTRQVGVFLAPLLVFVPVGLVRVPTARRTPITLLVLIGFLSAPLAACLVVPEPYAVDRELGPLPFGVLAATFGVKYLIDERGKAWRIAGLCLLALVPLHFAFFCVDYFGSYRLRQYRSRRSAGLVLARGCGVHARALDDLYVARDGHAAGEIHEPGTRVVDRFGSGSATTIRRYLQRRRSEDVPDSQGSVRWDLCATTRLRQLFVRGGCRVAPSIPPDDHQQAVGLSGSRPVPVTSHSEW